jgi:peptide/nickel transport system substrate-binding protein
MEVREGAVWHNGDPVTPEDVVWSLERAGKAETGNPIQFVWSKAGNYQIDGNKITGDVLEFEPTFFKWMAFLTGYVLPKKYYESVGAAGFEAKPIGSGPYMVDEFQQCVPAPQGQPELLGRQAGLRDRHLQVHSRRDQPRRRGRIGSSDVTLEIPTRSSTA